MMTMMMKLQELTRVRLYHRPDGNPDAKPTVLQCLGMIFLAFHPPIFFNTKHCLSQNVAWHWFKSQHVPWWSYAIKIFKMKFVQ